MIMRPVYIDWCHLRRATLAKRPTTETAFVIFLFDLELIAVWAANESLRSIPHELIAKEGSLHWIADQVRVGLVSVEHTLLDPASLATPVPVLITSLYINLLLL